MGELRIWMLDDGIPGHWSMTEGLVRLIAELRPARAERIPVRWRWGGARQLFQYLERLGSPVPETLLRACAVLPPATAGEAPDLIVSRGGGTLFLNAWLARRTGAANIFIGTLRGLPPRLFRAVVLQREGLTGAPYFAMPLSPTRIDPARLPEQVAAFPWTRGRPAGRVASLFLGGNGAGYRYTRRDWADLAAGMRRLHESSGLIWCVASSRRTPPEAETLLRAEVPPAAIHEACWWHAGDRRPCLDAFLGASELAFCTEDSMSMLEECMASGRPVVALGKPEAEPAEAFRAFLRRRREAGCLLRVELGTFATTLAYPVRHAWRPVTAEAMLASTGELLDRLGL